MSKYSLHLRQLSRYGFVTEAQPGRDRRERRYQMPDNRIRLPRNDVVTRKFFDVVIEREMHSVLEWSHRQHTESPDWQGIGSPVTGVAVMTAAEVAEVRQKLRTLLEPYFARAVASGPRLATGQRYIRYFLAGTPMAELDLNGSEEEAGDD